MGAGPGARARWLGVVLILLALAALVWQAYGAGQLDEPAAVRLVPLNKPSLSEMLASVDSVKLGQRAASAAELAASAPLPPDEVEVCGLGRVKADAAGQPRNLEPIRAAAQSARERLLPTLLNSPDETTRAAGLLLQSLTAFGPGDSLMPANVFARDTLANMAMASHSPQVYAWAMRACQGQRGQGMCQLLSAEQWARLDPGNAFVWLQVASDARARHDTAALGEAMFRVSRATRSDARWGSLTETAITRMPVELSPLAKGALVAEIFEADAATELPVLVASQQCSPADVHDANRHQTCAAVAEVLNTKGSTLIEVALGAAIGQRVGWSVERVAAAREERDAVAQLSVGLQADSWSCAALTRAMTRLSEVGRHGEVVAMRSALKQATESVPVLAHRYRMAAAQQAAQAASAASAPASAAAP